MPKASDKKPLTPEELAKQVEADQSMQLPAEKPLKINNPKGFDDTIGKLVKPKPQR